jgi:tetratricopeptide (TPR) repeat protein
VRRAQGKQDEALDYYNEYLEWALKTGATRHELIAYHNIGMVYLAKQDFERARDFFDKALELNRPLRDRVSAVLSLAMKGLTFEMQGASTIAVDLYRESLKLAQIQFSDSDVYGRVGRMLLAHEPQEAAYFLTKYLGQSPQDSEEIEKMLANSRVA